jgi:hypothetical protein
VLPFDYLLESVKCAGPKVAQNSADRVKSLRIERIQPAGAFATLVQQSSALKNLQMVTNRLLCDLEVLGDLAGCKLAALDEAKNLATVWIRESTKNGVSGCSGVALTDRGGMNGAHGVEDRTPTRILTTRRRAPIAAISRMPVTRPPTTGDAVAGPHDARRRR